MGSQKRWKSAFVDAIYLFCKNGLPYRRKFRIEGLFVVTLDDEETVVVNINEKHCGSNQDIVFPKCEPLDLELDAYEGSTHSDLKPQSVHTRLEGDLPNSAPSNLISKHDVRNSSGNVIGRLVMDKSDSPGARVVINTPRKQSVVEKQQIVMINGKPSVLNTVNTQRSHIDYQTQFITVDGKKFIASPTKVKPGPKSSKIVNIVPKNMKKYSSDSTINLKPSDTSKKRKSEGGAIKKGKQMSEDEDYDADIRKSDRKKTMSSKLAFIKQTQAETAKVSSKQKKASEILGKVLKRQKEVKEAVRKSGQTTSVQQAKLAQKIKSTPSPGRHRYFCGSCAGCNIKEDCGECEYCLDKPKFGGPNVRKQKCMRKRCVLQKPLKPIKATP